MRAVELITILLIVLADATTTYMLMSITGTCSLEGNPLLRMLCEAIGYGATWIWAPIEFVALALAYEVFRRLRKRLGIRIEIEKIFIVLATVAIANNILHLVLLNQQ